MKQFQGEHSAHFAKVLPELFSMFKTDPAVLGALVQIPQVMHLDTYVALKAHKVFLLLLFSLFYFLLLL
jgi:flagellar biosynthesis regulator FlbT